MSYDYCCNKAIPIKDLFDGRLKVFGVVERLCPHPPQVVRVLTDGTSDVWVGVSADDHAAGYTTYGLNAPYGVFTAIGEVFDVWFHPWLSDYYAPYALWAEFDKTQAHRHGRPITPNKDDPTLSEIREAIDGLREDGLHKLDPGMREHLKFMEHLVNRYFT